MLRRDFAFSLGSVLLGQAGGAGRGRHPPAELPPLHLPAHPRLLLTDAEFPAVKARLARVADFAARYQVLLRAAEHQVRKAVDLPPRGGQWFHGYVCKKDGANLQTAAPTEHRCPVCGTVYRGWPYDDAVLMRTHGPSGNAVRDLGLTHRLRKVGWLPGGRRPVRLRWSGGCAWGSGNEYTQAPVPPALGAKKFVSALSDPGPNEARCYAAAVFQARSLTPAAFRGKGAYDAQP